MQTHLFLHHILRYNLESDQLRDAVSFALHYQHLVFFAHALEILLHSVVEEDNSTQRLERANGDDGGEENSVLSRTVEFLDYFDASLDVVVGCARKIEITRWPRLFDIVGSPKSLFEVRTSMRPTDFNLIHVPDMSSHWPTQDSSIIFISIAYPRATRRELHRSYTPATDSYVRGGEPIMPRPLAISPVYRRFGGRATASCHAGRNHRAWEQFSGGGGQRDFIAHLDY